MGGSREHRFRTTRACLRALAAVVLLAWAGRAHGGEPVPPNRVGGVIVNYIYAAEFGLGGYNLDDLSVGVFTLPLRYTFEVADPLERETGPWRLRLHFPLKFGYYRLDSTLADGSKVDETQETLTSFLGLEVMIPLSRRWTLKPLATFGFGRAFADGSAWFYLYAIGARHRYERPWRGFTFLFGNMLMWAGNSTFSGRATDAFGTLRTGIGAKHGLGLDAWNLKPDFETFFVHHNFFPSADFARLQGDTLKVRNQFEFGVSIGRSMPWKLLFLTNPRIGVGYRFGDGLRGVRVHTGFPF